MLGWALIFLFVVYSAGFLTLISLNWSFEICLDADEDPACLRSAPSLALRVGAWALWTVFGAVALGATALSYRARRGRTRARWASVALAVASVLGLAAYGFLYAWPEIYA